MQLFESTLIIKLRAGLRSRTSYVLSAVGANVENAAFWAGTFGDLVEVIGSRYARAQVD